MTEYNLLDSQTDRQSVSQSDRQIDRQIDISFCLPVYNVSPYLEDCLQSIIRQNLDAENISYEIFCIDDGSQDGSYEFLLEKIKKIPQLRVEKNDKNKGVSYTRNRLIREARGKYIWFVDPDDMLYSKSVTALIDIMEQFNADVVLANYIKIDEDKKYEERDNYSSEEIEPRIVALDTWSWLPDVAGESRMFSLYRGIFNKKFLLDNKLFLNEEVTIMEDALLYYELKLKNPLIVKAEFVCYQVRQRQGSAMRANSVVAKKKKFESLKNLIKVFYDYAYSCDNVECEAENRLYSLVKQATLLLVQINDRLYVRRELKKMKENKFYPKFLRKTSCCSIRQKILFFLLKMPMCFYIMNTLYTIKSKKV